MRELQYGYLDRELLLYEWLQRLGFRGVFIIRGKDSFFGNSGSISCPSPCFSCSPRGPVAAAATGRIRR